MSRLSWSEIRTRAHRFSNEWRDAKYERGETQTFYNEFFEIFGISRRRVASFEEPVKKLGNKQGFIDLFWKGLLLVEQKSAGRNLLNARQQAFDYFPGIKEAELPRYVLACDFQNFELYDLEAGDELRFPLRDLHLHIDKFGFILGIQKREFKDQDPVNIEASTLMGRLHDGLLASGYKGHNLERFLVRLLFCLFADDTGIFDTRDVFYELIRDRTAEDGHDVGEKLAMLFQVLDTPEDQRAKTLHEDFAKFPYVNGELFGETLRLPSFDSKMRSLLLEACEFNWDAISPAIFGALFQHVSGDAAARRAQGEHYTTENHILRLIGPLFVDDLKAELTAIQKKTGATKERELKGYCDKLAKLRFFDPACGCGNFLIIAYREIRLLETEALEALYRDKSGVLDIEDVSGVNVNQFYGIEINEFPARIAEVAMWMMDHIMNNRLGLALTQNFARIPLKRSPHIVHGDALELDWADVLPSTECSYVYGNPPFLGAKYQSDLQRAQVRRIANLGKSGGTLDLVCAWYLKAGAYVQGSSARIAFVSTNSITQGEQVAQLWPRLFNDYGLEIAFGHRTFDWTSDAKSQAHVHVVILGLTLAKDAPKVKRLFSYPSTRGEPMEVGFSKLSPYLIDASRLQNPHVVVPEVARPINSANPIKSGTQPIDDGHYLFTESERLAFVALEPAAESLFRPFIGTKELVQGKVRWILFLGNSTPASLAKMPQVLSRMQAVKEFRLRSDRPITRRLADFPTRLNVEVFPVSDFLALPEVSSERREYMPIAYLKPPTIPSNKIRILENASPYTFAILTSRMHMSWMKTITGRLESRYQYSIGVVYNNYPWPASTAVQKQQIEVLGRAVLNARAEYPTSTLGDLYDPLTMPVNLRKAHQALDAAVDKLYKPAGFKSDTERVEHLLGLYEQMTSLFATKRPAKSRGVKR